MREKKNVLFIGPLGLKLKTGQSLSFVNITDNYKLKKIIINSDLENLSFIKKVIKSIKINLEVLEAILFLNVSVIYITSSRSVKGSAKEFIALVGSRIFKIPLIQHLHGRGYSTYLSKCPYFYRKILVWGISNTYKFITLGKSMVKDIPSYIDPKIVVIQNPYISTTKDTIKVEERNNEIPIITYLSNLMPEKNIIELIKVSIQIEKDHPNSHILIIAGQYQGDTDNRNVMAKKINDLLENNRHINLIGAVNEDQKIELLLKTDFLCLPSKWQLEGIPLCIIEAAIHGCCILIDGKAVFKQDIQHLSYFEYDFEDIFKTSDEIFKLMQNKNLISKLQESNRNSANLIHNNFYHLELIYGLIQSANKC